METLNLPSDAIIEFLPPVIDPRATRLIEDYEEIRQQIINATSLPERYFLPDNPTYATVCREIARLKSMFERPRILIRTREE